MHSRTCTAAANPSLLADYVLFSDPLLSTKLPTSFLKASARAQSLLLILLERHQAILSICERTSCILYLPSCWGALHAMSKQAS